MSNTKTKEIGGKRYLLKLMPGRLGIKTWHRLLKLVGPGMAKITGAVELNPKKILSGEAQINGDMLGLAVQTLADNLDDDSTLALIDTLLEHVSIVEEGKTRDISLDSDFAGEYLDLYKVLFEQIKFNYKSFFGDSVFGKMYSSATKTLGQSKSDSGDTQETKS